MFVCTLNIIYVDDGDFDLAYDVILQEFFCPSHLQPTTLSHLLTDIAASIPLSAHHQIKLLLKVRVLGMTPAQSTRRVSSPLDSPHTSTGPLLLAQLLRRERRSMSTLTLN